METYKSPDELSSGSHETGLMGVAPGEDSSVYNYINSSVGSFEQFKIEIGNVNKHITVSAIRKFLLTHGFDASKVKPSGHGFFFANLLSAEERDRAVEKLNGVNFRGRELRVKVARPKPDPLMVKRSHGNVELQRSSTKKLKTDDGQTDNSADNSIAPFANIPYDPDQLKRKQNTALLNLLRVRNNIKKVNKFKYCESCLESGFMSQNGRFLGQQYCPITPSPIVTGYRNKAKFTIGFDLNGKGPVIGMRVGKYKDGSTAVAYSADALLFSESTAKVIASMQAFLDAIYNQPHEGENANLLNRIAERVQVYDMVAKTGHWQSLTLRESRLNDRLIEIEIRRQELTDEDIADLCTVLKQWFESGGQEESAAVTSIVLISLNSVSQQSGKYGEHWVFGKKTITELCCGLNFEISRDAFFQVNTVAAEKLFEDIRGRCKAILERENKSTNDAILLDVCCGAGVIGLCLADCFDQVVGIEMIPSAVHNAKRNAEINGIKNAEFYVGKAEELLKDLMKVLPKDKEIIAILDPPRAGVHRGVIEAIRQCSRVKHLVFVACDLRASEWNFEALARPPSKKYVGAPFLPTAARCVDLFPHTPSIEVVVSLKRLAAGDCNHAMEMHPTGEATP
nr:growth factor receptor bound protein [Hymenolepis microstoma]